MGENILFNIVLMVKENVNIYPCVTPNLCYG